MSTKQYMSVQRIALPLAGILATLGLALMFV